MCQNFPKHGDAQRNSELCCLSTQKLKEIFTESLDPFTLIGKFNDNFQNV